MEHQRFLYQELTVVALPLGLHQTIALLLVALREPLRLGCDPSSLFGHAPLIMLVPQVYM